MGYQIHEGGRSKKQQIGMGDPFSEAQAPTKEHIDLLREMMEQEGIKKVEIGN